MPDGNVRRPPLPLWQPSRRPSRRRRSRGRNTRVGSRPSCVKSGRWLLRRRPSRRRLYSIRHPLFAIRHLCEDDALWIHVMSYNRDAMLCYNSRPNHARSPLPVGRGWNCTGWTNLRFFPSASSSISSGARFFPLPFFPGAPITGVPVGLILVASPERSSPSSSPSTSALEPVVSGDAWCDVRARDVRWEIGSWFSWRCQARTKHQHGSST
jgi:hypothetical protein